MPTFQTADATTLHYEDYGAGRPIVLVASWTLGAPMWEYQVPFLVEHGYRCVLPERRGHGRSGRPAGGYDLDTMADDLAELLDALDLTAITLVGMSAGGGEVARYLQRHGTDRVAGVAFLSAVLPFLEHTPDNPAGLPVELCELAVSQFRSDRPKWFAERAQGYFATHLGNDVSPALIEDSVRQCLSCSPVATVDMWRSAFHTDHRDTLRALELPVLVVHGSADQSAPVELTGRRTAELVPGCDYREYPTAGHGLYVTHRDQLNADLLELAGGPR